MGYAALYEEGVWEPGTHGIWVTQLSVRMITAALLLIAGFDDRRTLFFGATLLLNATPFARTGIAHLASTADLSILSLLAVIPLEALFPLYFWRFARVFPEAFLPPAMDRVLDWAQWTSFAIGLFLIGCNLALWFYPALAQLSIFSASDQDSVFSPILYSLVFPILVVLWLRMRSAREEERRRVQVFIFGLMVTLVPTLLFIILVGISASVREFILQEHIYVLVIPFMQLIVLASPMITTYAVLVERVLPMKLLMRQTLRYSLGIGFIALAIALPMLLLLFYLYNSRTMSVETLFEGFNGLFLVLALGISLYLLSQRHRARHYLEELLYRGRYDANELLAELGQAVQGSESLAEAARAAQITIDRALHPQNVHILFISDDSLLRDPLQELADLPLKSGPASQLLDLKELLDVRNSTLGNSDEVERWLSQANARFLLPVRVRSNTRGILVFGEKRSEIPYAHPDFNFLNLVLNTVMVSGSHLLEAWDIQEGDRVAFECDGCGLVVSQPEPCPDCSGVKFSEALLPKVLHQHYEITKVIGGGGMGVVYLAQDLGLHRPVVLKTVASASPAELKFLRDEARLMATLSHPHIATIYRFESYQGMPILVCEYLENGTLEDITRDGYLEREELVEIVDQIVHALKYLHDRGVSHGDVKPSNIGFDTEETAKLLDFGLSNAGGGALAADSGSASGGTYAYMSPEKILNQDIDQRADLWALAVTLFEAMYGVNPFAGPDPATVIERVTHAQASIQQTVDTSFSFFETALNDDINRRPQTAEQFRGALRAFF